MKPRRVEILGVPTDCVGMKEALNRVEEMISGNRPETVIAVNPEKVIKGQKDPQLLDQLKRAGLLIPDGIGVVFAARILKLGKMERVPGSELMPALCERAAKKGYRVFLFGGNPDVNQRTVKTLKERFPGIQIVGSQHGYLADEEIPALIERINESSAQILFIALGSPKQELWMDQNLSKLNIKVCQGVGGTFDVIAGQVKRAPNLMRRIHLEWFYRLSSNPKRFLRQTACFLFAYRVFRKRLLGW
ncbi:MAG: WecB/TagA/CpsF family glycosyltransferase [Nitrospiria bacterium]